jgi:hypothetical protein
VNDDPGAITPDQTEPVDERQLVRERKPRGS